MFHDTLAVSPRNPNPYVTLPTGPRKTVSSHLLSVQITGRARASPASRELNVLPIALARYSPLPYVAPDPVDIHSFLYFRSWTIDHSHPALRTMPNTPSPRHFEAVSLPPEVAVEIAAYLRSSLFAPLVSNKRLPNTISSGVCVPRDFSCTDVIDNVTVIQYISATG